MIADGLIIATPNRKSNGSTAYNLSAGGSIVMESCECYCITPLAAHSLSFRPLILPIDAKVTVKSSKGARVKPWVFLDGASSFELDDEEAIQIDCSQEGNISMIVKESEHATE